ncbi:helicase-exonuclease AddAB subunit AddA [Butyrivibrio sp. AE3009]|uniref:helicase-exonuclease AddAB subunit AddA n=1 Tax=Butyrivibrio sp. AE3009 TaxID=1280666 RepID=UPI0003B441BC|nr:helicase-exonuclease AddAB subunit AddA [Butyrivibrio sp. AE3009]
MAIKFTTEQQAVIDQRNANILVSAAAGSGKTAVLVERIIQMVLAGLDIDHLLVVTFTKAAASQMKEKITLAIQKRLQEEPDNKHLQKQETLIHNAKITTIDSFCQYVVKNNFNNIGLDPSFRVGDEGELKLVQEEVMKDMLEEEYALALEGQNPDFLYVMNYFGVGSSDEAAISYIMQLYDFAMSMPWPEDYINDRMKDYDCEGEFDSLPWVQDCVDTILRMLAECRDDLVAAEKICCDPDGPHQYGDNIQNDLEQFEAVLGKKTYDELFDAVRVIQFQTLSRKKDDTVSESKKKNVKDIRDSVKKKLKNTIIEKYLALPAGTVLDQMKLCSTAVHELCRLALKFKALFDEKKREKGLIDFSDMEHFALRILVDHPDEESSRGKTCEEIIEMCTPTAVALEYRNFFREVLIDEYQDSNNVQELILKSISGEKPDISERFMVGDVKQSIYKFRLARPEIFMDKLGTFVKDGASENRRIDLHMNFRSRKEVLDITNYIFDRIMGKDLGGVEYDADARLVFGAKDAYGEPDYDITPELLLVDIPSASAAEEGSGQDYEEGGYDPEDGAMEGVVSAAQEEPEAFHDLSDFEGYSAREKEALAIAEKIHALRQENPALQFKDIVILLRSPSGWDTCFKRILESQQIPAYVESKSGYFEAYEVAVMLNLLSLLNNPTKDIPLVSVMHSVIGGFSDEELARVRVMINGNDKAREQDSMHGAIKALLAGSSDEDALTAKLRSFITFIEELREMSVYTPVHELLEYIIDRTGFDCYISALPGGNQRKANLELLLNKAVTFEKSSFKGLFHFVRYIEHIKLIQVDYGEAGIIDENADVVRIMSIHKSKGLEFPVVFVAGMSKRFNMRDTKGDLISDMDLGVGVKCIDLEHRLKYDTLKRLVIADKMTKDSLGEELRIFYVALTRAKEKLIMTASVKGLGDKLAKALNKMPLNQAAVRLPFSARFGAMSYYDWTLPAVLAHPSFEAALDKLGVDKETYVKFIDKKGDLPAFCVTALQDEDLRRDMIIADVMGNLRKEELKRGVLEGFDQELAQRLKDKFESRYAFENLKGLYTKTTVTELKKHLLEEMGEVFGTEAEFIDEDAIEVPFDMEDVAKAPTEGAADVKTAVIQRLSGADRGTAYHRIMELLDENIFGDKKLTDNAAEIFDDVEPSKTRKMKGTDLDNISKRIYVWMKDLADKKVIPPEYPQSVWSADVTRFLGSSLGQRMATAYRTGNLMREKPFMMGISAADLDSKFPPEETVLIQGIVDAWFFEGDDIVLMDYKTDRVDTEEELVQRYSIQLQYYKRALEAATGKKVKEIYIYSFRFGTVIPLNIA